MSNLEDKCRLWIESFLATPSPFLNGLPPCAFAKTALLKKQISFIDDDGDLFQNTKKNIEDFLTGSPYEVIVLFFDPTKYTVNDIHQLRKITRETYSGKDLWTLFDHPLLLESEGDLNFNFKEAGLVIIQKLSKLNIASKELDQKGYYKNWSKEYYEHVVLERPQTL